MTPDEVLEARRFVRTKVIELKEEQPTAQGKITLRELMDQHLADWRSARDEHRSPRTEAAYRELWDTHILPFALDSGRTLGEMTIQDITPQLAQQVKLQLPKVVTSRHPLAKRGGTVVTNRALQQLQAAFKFAFRMGMVPGNPFSEEIIVRYAERSDGYSFSDQELKAIGAALVRLEALTTRPRPPLPYRSLAGIRLLFLTGARPSELTEAYIDKRPPSLRVSGSLCDPGRPLPTDPRPARQGRPRQAEKSAWPLHLASLPSYATRQSDTSRPRGCPRPPRRSPWRSPAAPQQGLRCRPQGGWSPASPAKVHAAYLQDLGTSGRSEPRARPTAPRSRRLAHDGHCLSAHDCTSIDLRCPSDGRFHSSPAGRRVLESRRLLGGPRRRRSCPSSTSVNLGVEQLGLHEEPELSRRRSA